MYMLFYICTLGMWKSITNLIPHYTVTLLPVSSFVIVAAALCETVQGIYGDA